MIKSHYTDARFENHGFVNHIHHIVRDMGVLPGTTTPLIEAYKLEMIQNLSAASGTGGKPRNLALFRKVLSIADPSAGAWGLIKLWEELKDYDDASAAGSVDTLPDGTIHIVMAFGKKLASGALQFQPWEASVARSTFAPPIERPARALIAPAQGGSEGGELVLMGGVGHAAWHLDTVGADFRIFSDGGGGVIVNAEGVFVPDGAGGLRRI